MEQKLREQLIFFFEKSTFLGAKKSEAIAQAKDLDETKIEKLLFLIVEEMRAQADEITYHSLRGDAREMAMFFNLLLQIGNFTSQELVNQYRQIVWQLQLKAFPLLSMSDRYEFVKTAVIWALKQKTDLRKIFEEYIMEWTADDINDFAERKEFIKNLESNEEMISSQKIKIGEEKFFVPQVKNWLQDFKVSFRAELTSLEAATYLSRSSLVKKMGWEEKEILEKLLTLYIWLKNPLVEVTPTNKTQMAPPAKSPPSAPPSAAPAPVKKVSPPSVVQPSGKFVKRPPFVPPDRGEILPIPPDRGETKPFAPAIQLYDQTADDLIKKSGLAVPLELRQRLKIIIISRLKDVRKIPETRERLTAAPAAGGVGLKLEEAERVIQLISNFKFPISNKSQNPNIKTEPVVSPLPASQRPPFVPPDRGERAPQPPPPPSAPAKPVPPTTPALRATPPSKGGDKPPVAAPRQILQSKTGQGQARKLQADIPAQVTGYPAPEQVQYGAGRLQVTGTSSDIQKVSPTTVKIVPQEKKPPKVELASLPPVPPKPPATMAIPQTPAGRSQVADVLYKPRLVGPLEELKEMSLIDFRRLSPQPKVTADKIYAKIELLAEQGFEKRVQGIKAWQASPVSAAYSAILNEGLGKAVPVARVIEERKKAGQETLTPEEFKAVMELNRRLRF